MTATFTITDAELLSQLAEGTATTEDGDHQIWIDSSLRVLTSDGPRSAQQASHYLQVGEWVDDLSSTCGQDCVIHVATPADIADEAKMAAVTRDAMSLAALYRQARSRGLVSPSRAYF